MPWLIIVRIRRMREGNIFSLFTPGEQRGYPHLVSRGNLQLPHPCQDWIVVPPHQDWMKVHPLGGTGWRYSPPYWDWIRYPQIGSGWGYPLVGTGWGIPQSGVDEGIPCQDWMGHPLLGMDRGTPCWDWMGVPLPLGAGWGYSPVKTGWGTPPPPKLGDRETEQLCGR